MAPIPITIVTGFLGSGKTTLILNLVPQLRAANPDYRLALLKNEFGDLAVDSQLAASGAVAGVRELLNGCICCNLVGSLGDALAELTSLPTPSSPEGGEGVPPPTTGKVPDRVVIETSGSAFPATLALEVNRLARATGGRYALDGVVSVVDVENWRGYEDTSYTARAQARYTDLVVFNKWEACGERRFDECLDRLGDLELDIAWVKSRRGWVAAELVFGVDGGLARALAGEGELLREIRAEGEGGSGHGHDHDHEHGHEHKNDHQSEVEVLSVTLTAAAASSPEGEEKEAAAAVDPDKLLALLRAAPRDEVYRIKAVLTAPAATLPDSDVDAGNAIPPTPPHPRGRYILNWAFGRWTFSPLSVPPGSGEEEEGEGEHPSSSDVVLRMTAILARYESAKWKRKLESGGFLALQGAGSSNSTGELTVTRIA